MVDDAGQDHHQTTGFFRRYLDPWVFSFRNRWENHQAFVLPHQWLVRYPRWVNPAAGLPHWLSLSDVMVLISRKGRWFSINLMMLILFWVCMICCLSILSGTFEPSRIRTESATRTTPVSHSHERGHGDLRGGWIGPQHSFVNHYFLLLTIIFWVTPWTMIIIDHLSSLTMINL